MNLIKYDQDLYTKKYSIDERNQGILKNGDIYTLIMS